MYLSLFGSHLPYLILGVIMAVQQNRKSRSRRDMRLTTVSALLL